MTLDPLNGLYDKLMILNMIRMIFKNDAIYKQCLNVKKQGNMGEKLPGQIVQMFILPSGSLVIKRSSMTLHSNLMIHIYFLRAYGPYPLLPSPTKKKVKKNKK